MKKFKDISISTLVVACIFWMPLFFYALHISLISLTEESIGYRYFYSLRMAFGHEGPWLPQGQLVTLYYVLLQYGLSFFHLPNDQLFPRIDYFSILASLLPILLTWLAFIRLSRNFEHKIWPLWIAIFFICMMLSSNLPTDFNGAYSWSFLPDYQAWAVPLAVFSAALLPTFSTQTPHQNNIPMSWFCKMGLLIGGAIGIKITYIFFPLSVFFAVILQNRTWRSIAKGMFVSAITTCFIVALIFWASTGFSGRSALHNYLTQTLVFFKRPNPVTGNEHIFSESLLPFIFSLGAVVLGLVYFNWSLASIGLLGLIYFVFVCLRFYSHSLIEYHAFILLPLVAIIQMYSNKLLSQKKIVQILLVTFSVLGVITLVTIHAWPVLRDAPNFYRQVNASNTEFHKRLASGPGAIWILTTGDNYRPNSVESALCKGGMNILDPHWGVSPYLATLFNKFRCAVVADEIKIANRKEMSYSTIGFARSTNETMTSAIHRVEKYFGISLKYSICSEIINGYTSPLIYCYREGSPILNAVLSSEDPPSRGPFPLRGSG